MKNSYLIVGLFLTILAGAAGIRYSTHKIPPAPEHIFIYDQSTSKIEGCYCLREKARLLISTAKFNKEVISLYSLGTAETGYKPKPVKSYEIPKNDSNFKDKQKEVDSIEKLLNDLESDCKTIPRTDATPLFQAIKIAVEQLKNKCAVESECTLYVQTDLEESIEPHLLNAFKNMKSGKEVVDLKKIDNTGITIIFAGISELNVSQGKKQSNYKNKTIDKNKAMEKMKDSDIWQKLWMKSFVQSNLVRFEPICSIK